MEFDRPRVKEMAKTIIREAQPRPWKVLLVYALIVTAVPIVLFCVTILPAMLHGLPAFYSHRWELCLPSFAYLLTFGLQFLLCLFSALMQMGYRAYCLKLWRRENGGYSDLFQGFRMPGKTLALFGLELLFTFLWTLPGFLVLFLLIMATSFLTDSTAILGVLLFAAYIGFFAYLLNRVLRYALAYNLLLDHPDWTAREALKESKALMEGRKWSYFVLELSFIGWGLLVCLIAYAVLFVAMLFTALVPLFTATSSTTFTLVVLLMVLLVFLTSAPLALWLQAYFGASCAGFYDCAVGRPPIPPAPPWQPSAGEDPSLPE